MEKPTAAEIPDVLRARRFELVDGDGAVRAVLGRLPGPDDWPVLGLAVLDGEGRARAWLALDPTGPGLVFDNGGNAGLDMGVDDAVADDLRVGPYLYLAGPDGAPVVGWRVDEDGSVVTVTAVGS
ncbi:MAG: hypothetical protein ACRDPR_06315 [Nocardioidaceae bacterium]